MKRICRNSCGLVASALLLAWTASTFAQDASPKKDTKITPEQTKELFRSLNQILSFASDDTKLPIHHEVKRRLLRQQDQNGEPLGLGIARRSEAGHRP